MAVSLSDSPVSTAEPDDLIDMTSADRRLAASSKLDEVRVEDSKKRFTTVRPLTVGSFFTSRSSERPKARASESSRSTSSLVRSAIEISGRRSSRPTGRENVGDERARHALQREVDPRRADDRLGVARGLDVSHDHVVAVKGDVDCPERDFDPAEVGDVAAEALGEGDAARVDADERGALEVTVPFDDLVSDTG